MNAEPLEIPEAVVDEEEIPLLEPTEDASEEMKSLFDQIPNVLKINGFGYFMKQVEYILDLPDDEFYASYLANYYSFNCFKETCSFADWVECVRFKVGGVRTDCVNFHEILYRVKTGTMSMIDAAKRLFTRRQMIYYGW